jgi:dienelactone hydrolase
MKRLLIGMAMIPFILGIGKGSTVFAAEPKISEKTVEYSVQGVPMKSFLAFDEAVAGKRPGVLVVPEWWGVNDYARRRARMLAELGYTALAVDMYGNGTAVTTPDEAGKLSSEVMKDLDMAKARFTAALEFLKKQPTVDPGRIAAIGYCFGGGVVLNMATQGVDLKGVASFHGSLGAVKPAQAGAVKAKVIVFHGADDKFITPEQIETFKRDMKTAGADFKFISYPGAVHSFTNPEADAYGKKFNLPLAYNANADQKSWDELRNFLAMIFK